MNILTDKIVLGITEDEVAIGSHLIHFWRTNPSIAFCSATMKRIMRFRRFSRKKYPDLDRVIREGRLVILRREGSASETLANIEAAFAAAVRKGATAIRYLGNLGMGRAPLPGRGTDEVIELENGATLLGRRYPCVIVCMYDVKTVSGRLLLNAGFGTHDLAVWGHALTQNAYFAPHEEAKRKYRAAL